MKTKKLKSKKCMKLTEQTSRIIGIWPSNIILLLCTLRYGRPSSSLIFVFHTVMRCHQSIFIYYERKSHLCQYICNLNLICNIEGFSFGSILLIYWMQMRVQVGNQLGGMLFIFSQTAKKYRNPTFFTWWGTRRAPGGNGTPIYNSYTTSSLVDDSLWNYLPTWRLILYCFLFTISLFTIA